MATISAGRTILLCLLMFLSATTSMATPDVSNLSSEGEFAGPEPINGSSNQGAWGVQSHEYLGEDINVRSIDIHPEGAMLALLDDNWDKVIIVEYGEWDQPIHELDDRYYDEMSFSPTGEYIMAFSDLWFGIWSTADWSLVFEEELESEYWITDFAWSGDGMRLVVVDYNEARIYEGPDWSFTATSSVSNPFLVAHHPSENRIWYIQDDATGGEMHELEDVPFVGETWVFKENFDTLGYGETLEVSPDGTMLSIADRYEGGVSVQSTDDYSLLFEENAEIYSHSWSRDSTLLAYGYDNHLIIRSTTDWAITHQGSVPLSGWEEDITGIEFTPDDSEMITTFRDTLQIWGPDADGDGVVNDEDTCVDTPDGESADSNGCSSSQKDTDNDSINDRDDECPRTPKGANVDTTGCSATQRLDADEDGINDAADECSNTPDEETPDLRGCGPSQRDVDHDGLNDSVDECPLLTIESCPSPMGWSVTEADETSSLQGIDPALKSRWDPFDRYIAALGQNGMVTIHDSSDGEKLHDVQPHVPSAEFTSLEWHPGGKWLALRFHDDSRCGIILWNTATKSLGDPVGRHCGYYGWVSDLAISPDGMRIALTTSNGLYVYWATNMTIDFEITDYAPYEVVFSPDGTRLVGIIGYGGLVLWDALDGYKLLETNSNSYHDSLKFTPLGDRILTFGGDNEIKIHNSGNLHWVGTLIAENGTADYSSIGDVIVSHDGTMVYAGGRWHYFSNESLYMRGVVHTFLLDDVWQVSAYSPNSSYVDAVLGVELSPNGSQLLVSRWQTVPQKWSPDMDADGVPDAIDECENTPLWSEVDGVGCIWEQQDDDSDSVDNTEDLCPDTLAGAAVDSNGCSDAQADLDTDGICDGASSGPSECSGIDYCPETPSGEQADANGCSWSQRDADGDGVLNVDDACNNTSSGDTVDDEGCTIDESDIDGDGVQDEWDFCLSTDGNDSVDSFGCSDPQVDADGDGVCDTSANSVGPSNCTSTDKCPASPANATVDANGCSWDQRDDDMDGVVNEYDSCPDTNESGGTYADGCSSSQRDADDDGVVDAADECADTPAEESVDAKGCASSQLEGEPDPIDSRSGLSETSLIAGGAAALVIVGFVVVMLLRRPEPVPEIPTPIPVSSMVEPPAYQTRGALGADGREWIEHPAASGNWFFRDPVSQQWVRR